MRRIAALLLLTACPAPTGGEDAGSSGGMATSAGTSTTGVDLCEGVVCGEGAHCDGWAGQCFCDPGRHGDANVGCAEHPDYCGDAEAALGHGVCTHTVPDVATWERLSTLGTEDMGLRRLGKFLAPLVPEAPLPTLFGDRVQYSLHICMLQEAFKGVFPIFTQANYLDLVYRRNTRTMIAGSVYEVTADDIDVRFVFTIEVPDEPYELMHEDEAYTVYRHLQDRFAVGELGFMPRSAAQQGVALSWGETGMPVVFNAGVKEPAPMQCE